MGKKASKRCTVCLGFTFPICFLAGVALIVGGVALYLKFPSVITGQVDKRVTVEEGHATYEQLLNPTIKIYKKLYFFNWTNHEEFVKHGGGVTPTFEEKGPYSFIEKRIKVFHNTCDEDRLNYTQTKDFYFDSATSGTGLSASDVVYTINIPYVAAVNKVKDTFVKRQFIKGIMEGTGAKLYIHQNITALAWGYNDKFVSALYDLDQYPLKNVSIQLNNSAEDQKISTIHTGVSNISEVGQYIQWDGHYESLDIWYGPDANKIRGTEGFFFKPNLKEGDNLTAFVDDVMRSFDLVYEGRVNHLGLNAFRYGIHNATFKSAFNEPKNAQYGSWCPDGMFYIGPTQVQIIPVYGSKPHFLDGDPRLLESVIGLKPDREKHDTVIDVEPITGANVFFHKQLQVNVQVNQTNKFDDMKNIKGYNGSGVLYMPVLYVCESAEIDQGFKDYLEGKGLHLVKVFDVLAPVIFAILIICGAVLFLVGVLTCIAWTRRIKRGHYDNELTPLLNDDN